MTEHADDKQPVPDESQNPHVVHVSRRKAMQAGAKLVYVAPLVLGGIAVSEVKLNAASLACW